MTMLPFKVIDFIENVHVANTGEMINTKPNEFEIMQELKQHRDDIDDIDNQIAELLGKRFRVAEEVAKLKEKYNIPVRIERRIDQVLENAEKNEEKHKLPPRLGYFLWREIIEATCYHEEVLLGYIDPNEEEEEF
ncbi:MAG: chorismate mutase [Pseudomonadota bacterium]